jgi:sec-independent protein translocase protein TatB
MGVNSVTTGAAGKGISVGRTAAAMVFNFYLRRKDLWQPKQGRIIVSDMPSFQDSAIIFVLALLLFGPKKLPVLARELGKWLGEFRRASNEFKMQMEEELRVSEQNERQEKIAAMEAAAPVAPALEGVPTEDPEHPHLPQPDDYQPEAFEPSVLPIATSGELNIMPPSTGLPIAQTNVEEDIAPLIESIPVADSQHHDSQLHDAETTESATHG